MYDNPAELHRKQLAAKQKEEEQKKKEVQDWYAKKEQEMEQDSKYKTRDFSMDDYYDYEYASRLKRFCSYNPGLGYYDDWYTNQWYYNPSPWAYNYSIYGPSMMYPGFYSPYYPIYGMNSGLSLSFMWGYPSWNMGYYPYYGMNYMGYPGIYSPYGYYYNPYSYYYYGNYYYPNSGYETYSYGPRGGYIGSNSPIRSYAGMSKAEAVKNIESGRVVSGEPVSIEQTPKFQSFDSYRTLNDFPGNLPRTSREVSVRDFQSSASSMNIEEPTVPANGIRSVFYRDVQATSSEPSRPSRSFQNSGSPSVLPETSTPNVLPVRSSGNRSFHNQPSFPKSEGRGLNIQMSPVSPGSSGGINIHRNSGGSFNPR
jgi:hypothetical protein